VSVSRRFAFRLASVQRLRRWSEERSSIALRRQIDRWREAQASQETLERAAEAARGALATESAAGVSAATLRLLAEGVLDAAARAKEAAALTQTEATAVDARRADLHGAAQARRTIDRLEEIQRGIWRVEATRAEQKITDEVASRQRGNA
jgi:flagellar export protein FliJ